MGYVSCVAVNPVHSLFRYLNLTFIVWLSHTPRHFEGGEWNSNGTCNFNYDKPLLSPLKTTEEQDYIKFWNDMNNDIMNYEYKPNNLFINDVTNMSLFRTGSHVNIYNSLKKMDSSQYCIPGIPDEWNRLTMTILCDSNSSHYGLLHNI